MSVGLPPVPDRDNREPSSREPADHGELWDWVDDRLGEIRTHCEARGMSWSETHDMLSDLMDRSRLRSTFVDMACDGLVKALAYLERHGNDYASCCGVFHGETLAVLILLGRTNREIDAGVAAADIGALEI